MNPIFHIDFYKADHRNQYPKGTEYVYSNFTPRSARLAKEPHNKVLEDFDDKVVFVGLQGYIQNHLIDLWDKEFFSKDKFFIIKEYKDLMDNALGKDMFTTEHMEALHDLGYLPLLIKALPEGSRVNIGVPVFTVINTNPDFFWLTNYIETAISAEIWKPITTATIAYEYKRLLTRYANETGAPIEFVDIQGHDFSARGMSGMMDASLSGIGHLSSFAGTDNVSAIDYINRFYNGESSNMVGCSVPATEHSVQTTCIFQELVKIEEEIEAL